MKTGDFMFFSMLIINNNTYSDQIKNILEKGLVKSILNRRTCMMNVVRGNKAKEVGMPGS